MERWGWTATREPRERRLWGPARVSRLESRSKTRATTPRAGRRTDRLPRRPSQATGMLGADGMTLDETSARLRGRQGPSSRLLAGRQPLTRGQPLSALGTGPIRALRTVLRIFRCRSGRLRRAMKHAAVDRAARHADGLEEQLVPGDLDDHERVLAVVAVGGEILRAQIAAPQLGSRAAHEVIDAVLRPQSFVE